MRQIILASQSPRRKQLLTQMGLVFETIPSNFDEQLDDGRSPEEVAQELGLGKALDVAQRYPDAIIIGSDIIVSLGSRQLGKAADEAEAKQMLHDACEVPNKLTCSIALVCLADHLEEVGYETAWVYFKPYNAARVEDYLRSGDWKDKAGAYGVQSGVAPLIDYVEGNFDTIMGLPTHTLASMLERLGIEARPVDVPSPVLVKS